jgi:hypothetical protein
VMYMFSAKKTPYVQFSIYYFWCLLALSYELRLEYQ